uniref:Uncharacterized protein n=1 Tax=viral metagenome TaxID=1070528 RepID=A0A6C0D7Y6_9ZZZZ
MDGRQLILQSIETKKKQSATIGTMNLVGFGVVGGLTAIGVSSPAGPVILGLSVAVSFVLRQYALVKELGEALISIQLDLDRMLIIYNLMETIAAENDIPLNTQNLNKCLKKILNYILTIIPKDALSAVRSSRNSGGFSISEITNIEVNHTKKPKLMERIGTWFAPQDYITILSNDFTRVIGSFTILLAEFNVLVLSKEDSIGRKWAGSNIFNLLVKRSSDNIEVIEEKPSTNESMEVLDNAVNDFKMYINPMLSIQNKEQKEAEIEMQYELQMYDILKKSFDEPNTRRYTNRLRAMTGTRKLIGGKNKK